MLFHAETPHALLQAMAESLAQIRDVHARHWLVLPAGGRTEPVLARWAHISGIASHAQEVQLRELIEQAAAGNGTRFDFEQLRLAVAVALVRLQNHPDSPIPRQTPVDPVSAAVLSWADAIARALDEALLCRRPDERWKRNAFLKSLADEPEVTEALRPHIGTLDATTFETRCQLWIEDWQQRGGLPHLWIQLDAGLPLIQWERLRHFIQILSKSHRNKIHLFFLCPSNEYWGECRLRHHRATHLTKTQAQATAHVPEEDPDFHPGGMLWAFGKCSQDLHIQLADSFLAESDGGTFLPSEATPQNLLGRLQQSCRNAAPFAAEDPWQPPRNDPSLTLHSAHSTLRELEICRDRILQARTEIPDLRYEEILLLLNDPQRQAPLLEAALRSGDGEQRCLPYRLNGFGQAIPGALAQSLGTLLQKIRGRLDFDDVQALLEQPLIAQKFRLNSDEGEDADPLQWLRDAQFRWGTNPFHRNTVQDVEETRWSLTWALQRLALGAIVRPLDSLTPVQPTAGAPESVPLARATGLGLARLSELARFAAALEKHRILWKTELARPVAEWNRLLRELVDTFLDCSGPAANPHWTRLQNTTLPGLERAAAAAACDLRADAYIRILEEKIASLTDSGNRGPGGIQVADLRQYAGVPARVILIAGLDEGIFPRRDTLPKWHPLALERRLGDPSLRDTDRHALLLAVLACRERLVLSYQGASDENAKPTPPSTAVLDLLQAIDATWSKDSPSAPTAHDPIVFQHPLNHFSPQSFAHGTDPRARGRLASDFEAARVVSSRTGLPPFPGPWSSSLPAPEAKPGQPEKIASLRDLLREPAKLFIRRLGILLPEREREREGGDLLTLDPLNRYQLRDEMLFRSLENGDLEALQNVWEKAGKLPRGLLGAQAWEKLRNELPPPPPQPFQATDRITREMVIPLDEPDSPGNAQIFAGTLREGWYQPGDSSTAFWYTASKKGAKELFQFQLESLLLRCASGEASVPVVQTTALFRDGEKCVLPLPSPTEAARLLGSLLPLFRLGRILPLPFWPEIFEALQKAKVSPSASDEPTRCAALRLALERWLEADFSGAPPPSEQSATQFAFRGCENPFEWSPDTPESAFLPEPSAPLAWRLFVRMSAWREALPSA